MHRVEGTGSRKGRDPSQVNVLGLNLHLEMFPRKPCAVCEAVRTPPFAAKIGLGNVAYPAVWVLVAHFEVLSCVLFAGFGLARKVEVSAHDESVGFFRYGVIGVG